MSGSPDASDNRTSATREFNDLPLARSLLLPGAMAHHPARDTRCSRPSRRPWLSFLGVLICLGALAGFSGAHAAPGPQFGAGSRCERALERCTLHLDLVWRGRAHGFIARYHVGRSQTAEPSALDRSALGQSGLAQVPEPAAVMLWYSYRLFAIEHSGLTMTAHSVMGLGQEFQFVRTGRWPIEPGLHGGAEFEFTGSGPLAGIALVAGLSIRAGPSAGWASLLRPPPPGAGRRWRIDYGPSLTLRIAPLALFRSGSR
jgi:hypothetical protein